MNSQQQKLIDDMAAFAKPLIASKDIDPLYPVLRELQRNASEESALWFTFLYLSYYNLASAYRVWLAFPRPHDLPPWTAKLAFATERRGFRTPSRFMACVNAYLAIHQQFGQREYLQFGWVNDNPQLNYELFWKWANEIPGIGRWAAFKWGELLKRVHGWNLAAPDMRMQFCSGPKDGLIMLYDLPDTVPLHRLNKYGLILEKELLKRGVDNPDWETLETILCNFHSLCDGRYYVGHDIDELQHVIESESSMFPSEKKALWDARLKALPHEYLGELHGWSGISTSLNKRYADRGEILTRPQFQDILKGR